ncbi:unnamed protein product [Paramecium pentaurelia]|uniref:Uncharacterized protein n=1 Tax=Paramecium pentaurelia TaxID=43138 RepID=A0A8S1UEJ1_9CILI|nr:unnamed protein product [Paramecium pentaurelia]
MQSKKKSSFLDSIKQFFNDAPIDDIIYNEANSTIPIETKQTKQSSQQSTKERSSDPNVFKIGNEDEANQIYNDEEEDSEQQTMSEMQKEYRILILYNFKQIGKPLDSGYQKKQIINFPPGSTFRVIKPIKTHKSLMDYLTSETERYLALDGGWIYFFQLISKDKFSVSSANSLNNLFQILIKKNEDKPTFRFIFTTKQIKRFYLANIEQQDLLFLKLKTECQKHGKSFNY